MKINRKMKWKHVVLLAIALAFNFSLMAQNSIIPQPVSLKLADGVFIINNQTSLNYPVKNKEIKALADYLANHIKTISGYQVLANKTAKTAIQFNLISNKEIGKEGYLLDVENSKVTIQANTKEGLFYGVQSLIQTLPSVRTNQALEVPFMSIKDYPTLPWRGMMLDVSRHFFTIDAVKEMIDLLALYKMNVFHWHLVDNEGWRLEIKKYPKLTSVGAWRNEIYGSVFYKADSTLNTKDTYKYGGYYTQEQAKEVVAYAKARNITVIPEIEMPGHSGAALAAYPQFSCSQKPQAVPTSATYNGVGGHQHINMEYCAGNDSSFLFLQDVLKEVMQIFPSEYIHVGGDEVEKAHWHNCPKCQARMKAENLKDEHELQSYFIKRMEKFINANNRKLLGWDEILEGGLAPTATVMSWRGEKGGIEAAKMGHDVIMSPSNPLYLNRYQADPANEPLAAKFSINTLDVVYNYNPYTKALPESVLKYIKGGQFAIWNEFISSLEHLEYMLLPRLPAVAEAFWTKQENKNFDGFVKRLNNGHFQSWRDKGIRFHQSYFKK